LLNPHGIGILVYPARVALAAPGTFRGLLEYLPPLTPGGLDPPHFVTAIVVFVMALLGLALAHRAAWRETRTRAVHAVALLTLAMPLVSARFVPLFALAGSLAAAGALGDLARVGSSRHRMHPLILPSIVLVVALLADRGLPLRRDALRLIVSEE